MKQSFSSRLPAMLEDYVHPMPREHPKTTHEIARPIMVRIHCGTVAIRDRIAERHQQTLDG